jgi:hyaluronan synthase
MNSLYAFLSNYFDSLTYYFQIAYFYVPLGIIGVWRWSVWIIRKSFSFFYKMPQGNFNSTLSIVVPVYNENPNAFRLALESWMANLPDEIIAVIDYSDETSIEIFKEFAKKFYGARLIVTQKPGKRPALADGARAAKSEIIALVDSDTIWSPAIKSSLLGPFADPKVGGLVTRQDILKPDTLARKIFKILLDDRYLLEYPFLATVSDAILCLSGRTAVYRREAIINDLDKLENETFWGQKVISGDDKFLTNLIHSKGWKSRYLKDVKVYTTGLPDLGSYLQQKLRWSRNALRADSKAIFSGWLWKHHKILALHMLDKFVSPITLVLAVAYFSAALYFKHWEVAVIIAAWWLVSRTIKIFPHLREKPFDIFILPVYVIISFVIAAVKIYSFVTMAKQGWITRWDKSRLKTLGILQRLLAYGTAAGIILAMFFAVFSYKNTQLRLAETKSQKLQTPEEISVFTPDKPRLSDQIIEDTKAALSDKVKSDPYGYYIVKAGDTIPVLRKRYNLPTAARILNAQTKVPLNNFAPLRVGQQIAISVENLRTPIGKNILTTGPLVKPPRVTYDAASNTIFVMQGGSVANLTKINRALLPQNRNLLEQSATGEWILRANLYIGKNVTLVLDGSEVKYLKLKSDSSGFVWIRGESGNLLISDTKITSWDEKNKTPDFEHMTGRAYIVVRNSGRMDILNSELGYLGYAGLPNRGGPFGGSYGVSWKIKNGAFRDNLLTGVVMNSKFHNNYFGLYTFGATGLIIRNNQFYENDQYGLDPHDDSNNFLIDSNQAYLNGNHGIIISKRCIYNTITNNVSYNNRLHGIMLDRESNNNLVQNNEVYGGSDGIALYASSQNIILNNNIHNNIRGLRMNVGSAHNFVENNSVISNSRGFYIYDQSKNNLLIKNQLRDNEIALTLKAYATQNEFYDNFGKFDNKRTGRVAADASDNNIQ